MCHFVFIASPLSVSEIRSMLPAGLTLDTLLPADTAALRALSPDAATFARLLIGNCSCDFFLERGEDGRAGERELRVRYRALGMARADVMAALERHRRRVARPRSLPERQQQLTTFVAEHARNAGTTLFLRAVSSGGMPEEPLREPILRTVAEVRGEPAAWLPELTPVLVIRE